MAKSAYEKMFEDGTAYKPIKINQPTPESEGVGMSDNVESEIDYSLFDSQMDERRNQKIEEAKTRKAGTPVQSSIQTQQPALGNKKVRELERRISMLEQALQLVMETQTKLLKESG